MDVETEGAAPPAAGKTPLKEANQRLQGAAKEIDDAADQAYQTTAAALAEIPPEAARPLLRSLTTLLGEVGGKLDPAPTSLDDPAVARALSAMADLSEDAAQAKVIDPGLVLDLAEITDAKGAQLAAGKLAALAKNREFQRWAASPAAKRDPAKAPEAPTDADADGDTDADADTLLQSRMAP